VHDYLMIYFNSNTYGPFSGTVNPGMFPFGPGLIRIVFISDPTVTKTGFTIQLIASPIIYNLVSDQPFAITQTQPGGFVYFSWPDNLFGKQLELEVDVFSYQGLQPPGLFVSKDHLPSLEKFDYTNGTTQDAGVYRAVLRVDNPPNARYFVGVFLYGTAAKMTAKYTWRYNFQSLLSGVKVTRNITNTEYWQVFVPVSTTRLFWQISRSVPGGYVVAYITQGTLPSKTNFQWVMDTQTQSYVSVNIDNPNPWGSHAANPGWYNIAVTPGAGTGNCGYILQADWN